MEKLGLNEIREKYLSFFESKGHLRLPSFSLVPHNDASLLLINAGMAPLKPYFTGAETPPRKRVTTCQKCIRTPDIDNVGKTARHGTFFEMLGNFSFGDYFKKEAIPWAWEFLTEVMKIPADRLYVTIYLDDDEAFEIWTKEVGLAPERVIRMGKEDNFWEHGQGPCGPCSEIHFDRGEAYGCGKPDCGVGCDCDRYIEVWNLVFTQFDRQEDGTYVRLPKPNIDTGMGLERLACVMQGVDNLFEVDTIRSILDKVCEISGKTYGADWKSDVSIRAITDHIRSTVMMISDGVTPSNESRGYVLRRLLRGAARHGKLLGIQGPFLEQLAELVIALSGDAYPNLKEKRTYILKIICVEEERFAATIEQGMALLGSYMEALRNENQTVLPGTEIFKLHDTYGFPLDLTRDILRENGFEADEEGFRREMNAQKAKSREAIKNRDSSWGGADITLPAVCRPTIFCGYETLECESTVVCILRADNTQLQTAEEGDSVMLITETSPFYAESGGQCGDSGYITTDSGAVCVLQTTKTADGVWKHTGFVERGTVEAGSVCMLTVDRQRRLATERNHSATHLLQKALRRVLGDHVHQAGSSVSPERLRFDFNHMQAVTQDQLNRIEEEVNAAVFEDYPVTIREMPIEEAKRLGATALFGEKYGNVVRVVRMGDYSMELCGGTHVQNTASVGIVKILHESAVAAGIRRIEAVTGSGARDCYLEEERILDAVTDTVKASYGEVAAKVAGIAVQFKALSKEIEKLKRDMAGENTEQVLQNAVQVGDITLVAARFDMLDGEGLREMAERLRSRLEVGVVLLASGNGDKVQIVAMATKHAVEMGVNCGKIVKQAAGMCGGGGGGRPDMAQAGGKNPAAIDEMLKKVGSFLL